MEGDPDLEARMETVAHRVEFVELLDAEGPLPPRDIVDALPYSRPTVTRALIGSCVILYHRAVANLPFRSLNPPKSEDLLKIVTHDPIRELREADLVEQRENGYTPTLPGVMAAEEYRRYETASRAILASGALLAPIPQANALPVEVLVDANTILAETSTAVPYGETVATHHE